MFALKHLPKLVLDHLVILKWQELEKAVSKYHLCIRLIIIIYSGYASLYTDCYIPV